MEADEELFACTYSHCQDIVLKFPFVDENGNKFCSPFCRRKFTEEKKAAIAALEADPEGTVSRKAG
jgi:hypothetical protein